MPRPGRSLWRLLILGPLVALVAGCATNSAQLNRALLGNHNPAAHGNDCSAHYLVYAPDVLEVTVTNHPSWCGQHTVNPDGRIILPGIDSPRVDGRTVPEIAHLLADKCGVPESQIEVHVAEYHSQHLYVQSEAPGLPRVVAYQGPETIVDFLQRVGGVKQGAAPRDVQVVRSHVADGGSPEVFHVDLEAILLKQDQRTNVTLQSFDQIYLGQSRGSCFIECVPPWLKPLLSGMCGVPSRCGNP